MSSSTKRDGKPKLASGQILDDVMKSVVPWNGEPHGWLRGRIELVGRAGPVVQVFVRHALENTTVFPRASSSKRGGYSWRDSVEMVKTELHSAVDGEPLQVNLVDAARRAESARTMQPAGAEERTNGTLYAMEVSLRTVAQIKRHAEKRRSEESKRSSSSSDSDSDDDGPPRRSMAMEFDGDGPPRPSIGGTKPGDPPPGVRTANIHNADPSMGGLDLAGNECGT